MIPCPSPSSVSSPPERYARRGVSGLAASEPVDNPEGIRRRVIARRMQTLCWGLCAVLTSTEAMARCTAPSSNVNMSAITAQRDAPIGSVISQGTVTTRINCTIAGAGPSDWSWLVYPASSNMDFGSSSELDARATAWPGVGIRWRNQSSASSGATAVWTTQGLNSWTKATGRGMPLNINNVFTDDFELVKTGPIATGTLPSMNLQYFHATPRSDNVNAYLFSLNMPEMPIRAVACAVTQASVVVPMGDFIPKTRFTGPGSTDVDIPFAIALNCDSGAQINIQLDGVAAGGAPGVLRLNAQADAASGLGVQILSGGLPVSLGMPMSVGRSTADGPRTIDFSARYYQVGGTVESGIANATATFTMTYN